MFIKSYYPPGSAVLITYPNTGIPSEVGIVTGFEDDGHTLKVLTLSNKRGKRISDYDVKKEWIMVIRMLPQDHDYINLSNAAAMERWSEKLGEALIEGGSHHDTGRNPKEQ